MRNTVLVTSLLMSSSVFADALGLRISAGMWSYDTQGVVRDSANVSDNFDINSELGLKDDDSFQGFLYFEHPVPILPNIRVGITDLNLSGTGTYAGGKDWNGTTLPAGTLTSSVDLSHTEIGLYYEIWDTGFDFDLGINAKLFDGTVTLTSSGTTATSTFDETIPMGYVHVGIPLVAGFSIAGDLSYISYDGDKFQDYLLRLRYDTDFMLGVELGYRSFTIDYADGNEFADVKIDGPYVNATLSF